MSQFIQAYNDGVIIKQEDGSYEYHQRGVSQGSYKSVDALVKAVDGKQDTKSESAKGDAKETSVAGTSKDSADK